MKKTMTRNIVIMAIVTVIMAVVLSLYIKNTGTVPAADNTASLADGTYTASEQGCLSEVAVTVTVTGGKVTNVAIDASGETPELGGAAAETLADELTKAGSTAGVDAVSGATLTSNAVFTAMDSCLAQAGTGYAGAEDLTDGTYTSSAKGCLSDVNVTVTVSGGKVSEVAINASGETPELGGAAAETLADALTKAGSTNGVDAVSGATITSAGRFSAGGAGCSMGRNCGQDLLNEFTLQGGDTVAAFAINEKFPLELQVRQRPKTLIFGQRAFFAGIKRNKAFLQKIGSKFSIGIAQKAVNRQAFCLQAFQQTGL